MSKSHIPEVNVTPNVTSVSSDDTSADGLGEASEGASKEIFGSIIILIIKSKNCLYDVSGLGDNDFAMG